jgi:hypothetical protein
MPDRPKTGERGRCSCRRNTAGALRLYQGEVLELVSRELGVTAARGDQTHLAWDRSLRAPGSRTMGDVTDGSMVPVVIQCDASERECYNRFNGK